MKLLVLAPVRGARPWRPTPPAGTRSRSGRATRPGRGLRQARENTRYLPGIPLPESLRIADGDPASAHGRRRPGHRRHADGGPAPKLQALRGCTAPVAWLCKGFEPAPAAACSATSRRKSRRACIAGALTGPSFAQEVAAGSPTALVAASRHAAVRDALVAPSTDRPCGSMPTTTSSAPKSAAR
jgi:glycerol-3-phosphate dehydrogenase (NAD(P)+)